MSEGEDVPETFLLRLSMVLVATAALLQKCLSTFLSRSVLFYINGSPIVDFDVSSRIAVLFGEWLSAPLRVIISYSTLRTCLAPSTWYKGTI